MRRWAILRPMKRRPPKRLVTSLSVTLVFALTFAGCGDRLAQREGESQLQWGERLSGQLGCPVCHSASGARLQGPPMGQQWLGDVLLRTGEVVTRDETYIRNSIVSPASQVIDDYFPVMVPYADLTEPQLDALVAFWKDRSLPPEPLQSNADAPPSESGASAPE